MKPPDWSPWQLLTLSISAAHAGGRTPSAQPFYCPRRSGGGSKTTLLVADPARMRNLARIDAEGVAAYLESSNPSNLSPYENVGFVACGEFELVGAENSSGPLTCGFGRAAVMVRWISGTARSTRITLSVTSPAPRAIV